MKRYTILAESVTGIKGKQLLKGETHDEGEIYADNIPALVEGGFIEEYTDEPAPVSYVLTAEDIARNPQMTDAKEGDTIELPYDGFIQADGQVETKKNKQSKK